jgi:hypothetical protein
MEETKKALPPDALEVDELDEDEEEEEFEDEEEEEAPPTVKGAPPVK